MKSNGQAESPSGPATIGWWVLSNGPIIITVAGGAVLASASAMWEFTERQFLRGILVLLVLIATSLLTERFIDARKSRHRLATIADDIKEMAAVIEDHGRGLDSLVIRRKNLSPLEDRFSGAIRISISGGSLTRLVNEYKHTFEGLVEQGCHIRILMVDPSHAAAEQLHKSVVYEVGNLEEYRRQIRGAINGLQGIVGSSSGRLDVRESGFVPPYSLVKVERYNGTNTLQVELYPFKVPARDRPTLMIREERDPKLYDFFTEQFEQMWESDLTHQSKE